MTGGTLLLLWMLAIAFLLGMITPRRKPVSPLDIAEQARTAKRDALMVEYLAYGFDKFTAECKASRKMDADARAAEKAVADTLGAK